MNAFHLLFRRFFAAALGQQTSPTTFGENPLRQLLEEDVVSPPRLPIIYLEA